MRVDSSWLCMSVFLPLNTSQSRCEPPKNGNPKEESFPKPWKLPRSLISLHVSLSKIQHSCHTWGKYSILVDSFQANIPDNNIFPTIEAYRRLRVQDLILPVWKTSCLRFYKYCKYWRNFARLPMKESLHIPSSCNSKELEREQVLQANFFS